MAGPRSERADVGGRIYGERGNIGADAQADRSGLEQLAALIGCVIGVGRPDMGILSNNGDRPVEGVDRAGETALRNSV